MEKKFYIFVVLMGILIAGHASFANFGGLDALPNTTVDFMVIGFDGKVIPTKALEYTMKVDLQALEEHYDFKTFSNIEKNFLKIETDKNKSIVCRFKAPKTFEMDLVYRVTYNDPKSQKLYMFEGVIDEKQLISQEKKTVKLYLKALKEHKISVTLDGKAIDDTKCYLENLQMDRKHSILLDSTVVSLNKGQKTICLPKGHYDMMLLLKQKDKLIASKEPIIEVNGIGKGVYALNSKAFDSYYIDASNFENESFFMTFDGGLGTYFLPLMGKVNVYTKGMTPEYLYPNSENFKRAIYKITRVMVLDNRLYCHKLTTYCYDEDTHTFGIYPSFSDYNGNKTIDSSRQIFLGTMFKKSNGEWIPIKEDFYLNEKFQLVDGEYKILIKCMYNPDITVVSEFEGEVKADIFFMKLTKVE